MAIHFGLAALSALAFGGGSRASRATDPTAYESGLAVHIDCSDLDLGAESGAAAMLERIRKAARTVCAPRPNGRDVTTVDIYNRRFKATVDKAVVTLGNPLVSALHNPCQGPIDKLLATAGPRCRDIGLDLRLVTPALVGRRQPELWCA